jgi:hypothetical protein
MITAVEASNLASSLEKQNNKDQLDKIEAAILDAANNSKFFCYIDFYPNPIVKNAVTKLGYEFGSNQGRYNETCIQISWGA